MDKHPTCDTSDCTTPCQEECSETCTDSTEKTPNDSDTSEAPAAAKQMTIQEVVQAITNAHRTRQERLVKALETLKVATGRRRQEASAAVAVSCLELNDALANQMMDSVRLSGHLSYLVNMLSQLQQHMTQLEMNMQVFAQTLTDAEIFTPEKLQAAFTKLREEALNEKAKREAEASEVKADEVPEVKMDEVNAPPTHDTSVMIRCRTCVHVDRNSWRCTMDENERRVDDWYINDSAPGDCPLRPKTL